MNRLTTVIPVYNGERFLKETLDSLAQQTRRPDRVVILDNCSTDGTEPLVRGFPGLPIEFRRNERNLGVIGNLNRALEFARETSHLHVLMADDLVRPSFCEKSLAALHEAPDGTLSYVLNEEIDQHGKVIGPKVRQAGGSTRPVPLREFLIRHAELRPVLLPGVVFKTSGSPPRALFADRPQVADGQFLADWAASAGQVVEISEYLCQYRLHPFSASSAHRYAIQPFVLDEWEVMRHVAGLLPGGLIFRRWSLWRLSILFAARSAVKVDLLKGMGRTDLAGEIHQATRSQVGLAKTWLGILANQARDGWRRWHGRPSRADELLQQLSAHST